LRCSVIALFSGHRIIAADGREKNEPTRLDPLHHSFPMSGTSRGSNDNFLFHIVHVEFVLLKHKAAHSFDDAVAEANNPSSMIHFDVRCLPACGYLLPASNPSHLRQLPS
jgi:hypothetical protein